MNALKLHEAPSLRPAVQSQRVIAQQRQQQQQQQQTAVAAAAAALPQQGPQMALPTCPALMPVPPLMSLAMPHVAGMGVPPHIQLAQIQSMMGTLHALNAPMHAPGLHPSGVPLPQNRPAPNAPHP